MNEWLTRVLDLALLSAGLAFAAFMWIVLWRVMRRLIDRMRCIVFGHAWGQPWNAMTGRVYRVERQLCDRCGESRTTIELRIRNRWEIVH